MALDIGDALKQGFERTSKKSGLMIIGLLFIASFLNAIFTSSLEAATNTQGATTPALALPIPVAASAALTFVGILASTIIGIVAIRTFVSDKTEHIPAEFFKRNIFMTTLNIIAAGLTVALVTILPMTLLAVPGGIIAAIGLSLPGLILAIIGGVIGLIAGIYMAVSLILTNVFVAAEDQNFAKALQSSWETTRDHMLPLAGLGIIIFALTLAISAIMSIPTLAGLMVIGSVSSQLGAAATSAFTTAVLAQAYRQLKDDNEEEKESEEPDEDSEDSEEDEE